MTKGTYPSHPVLLVDDEASWLHSFEITLRGAGIDNVLRCQDSRKVLPLLAQQGVSVIALDLNMPDISGEELLSPITQNYPEIPVIIITGVNQAEPAVTCMKLGAFDFFVKTTEADHLITGVRRAIALRELQRENALLRQRFFDDTLEHPEAFSAIVTTDPKMRSIFCYIEAVAPSFQPVLISGESGVGKELVAEAVHRLSNRSGNFVPVSVAGLDDNVFADTLFGHKKGAFTGADAARGGLVEQARGGTLFLDEIGDLSMASQVKLLRLLQEGEYFALGSDVPKRSDARIIAATNRDLQARQDSGEFRNDLYYRLRTHHIHIPPLRERLGDIPLLVHYFLEEASESLGKKKPAFPKELITLLNTYDFPGNVRELQSMIFDAVSQHKTRTISLEVFRSHIQSKGPFADAGPPPSPAAEKSPFMITGDFPTLKEATEFLILEAMKRANGIQSIAAGMLGITRQALNQRLKQMKS